MLFLVLGGGERARESAGSPSSLELVCFLRKHAQKQKQTQEQPAASKSKPSR